MDKIFKEWIIIEIWIIEHRKLVAYLYFDSAITVTVAP